MWLYCKPSFVVHAAAGTTTSSMTLCLAATALLLTRERMAFLLAPTSTHPMGNTPLELWVTATMEALTTRSSNSIM